MRPVLVLGVSVVLAACGADPAPVPADRSPVRDSVTGPTFPDAALLDSGQRAAVAGTDGWNYQQSVAADIDGDGQVERVVIMARVEVIRGRPVWDDGQQWQVYVEEADGSRTTVYARRLQLGMLSVRLDAQPSGQPHRIVMLEQLPDRLSVYEVQYRSPTGITALVMYQRSLDATGEIASPVLP